MAGAAIALRNFAAIEARILGTETRLDEVVWKLVDDHGGEVPDDFGALLELRGVARKTANCVLGTAFGKAEGIVVDTHVIRISNLLGITREKDPVKIERDLMELLPEEHRVRFTHQIIDHGRAVCIARRPQCDACTLAPHCPSKQ